MSIYQHYRKDEHEFIDQVLSWMDQVERSYQPKLTDFLNPREQLIFQQLARSNSELVSGIYGGTADAERSRAVLAPAYEQLNETYYEIVLLEAGYPDKFITLAHRDVMGAFLSMGMERKKLGDISVKAGKIQLFTTADIAAYVRMNLTEIKRAKISWSEVPLEQFDPELEQWETISATVSSLRLDAIVKEIYRMSRQQASEAINKGIVKVNFKTVEDISYQLEEGDLISIRGKGRSKLLEIAGRTKRDKLRITAERLK